MRSADDPEELAGGRILDAPAVFTVFGPTQRADVGDEGLRVGTGVGHRNGDRPFLHERILAGLVDGLDVVSSERPDALRNVGDGFWLHADILAGRRGASQPDIRGAPTIDLTDLIRSDIGSESTWLLQKMLRAGEGRILRKLKALADTVDEIEPDFESLSDAELRAMTDEFKKASTRTAKRWMTCCPRRSRPCGRRLAARSASATSTCSSWAERRCTWATSPR